MACFVVSFELRFPSELARRRFCDEIERLGGTEVIGGVYLIELDGTAEEVRDHLARYLTPRDRLIVVEFGTPPCAQMPLAGAQAWIVERFAAVGVG